LSDGNVQTCGFLGPLGERSIGELPKESLNEVWRRLVNSSHIKELEMNLVRYNSTMSGLCTNCLAIALASLQREGKR